MKEPRRLDATGGGATALERRLLRAGRSERMPPELKERMEAGLDARIERALGIGVAAAAMSAMAGKAATKVATATTASFGGKAIGTVALASAGVLAIGFGGGIVGARLFPRRTAAPAPAAISSPLHAPAASSAPSSSESS